MKNITVSDAFKLLETDCKLYKRKIMIEEDDIEIPYEGSLAYEALKDYLVEAISYEEKKIGDFTGYYSLMLKTRFIKSGEAS